MLATVTALLATVVVAFGLRALWARSKRSAEQLRAVKAAAVDRFGLDDLSPDGILPNLRGRLDGHLTSVDVHRQDVSDLDGDHQRPWTRVRVQLEHDPGVLVHVRGLRTPGSDGLQERSTGDSEFDRFFQVFSDEESAVRQALTAATRRAFVAAPTPVSLSGRVVYWTQKKYVRQPEVLLDAIASCSSVASSLRNAIQSESSDGSAIDRERPE